MSFLDSFDSFDPSSVDLGNTFDPGNVDIPNPFASGDFPSAPMVPPVLNLPSTGNTGLTGIIKDVTNLVSNVYAGEAQVAQAQANLKLTNAQNALALRNVNSLPGIGTLAIWGGLGLLAIVLVEKANK